MENLAGTASLLSPLSGFDRGFAIIAMVQDQMLVNSIPIIPEKKT